MRVAVDAACWANSRGYGRYTRGLITALLELPSRHDLVLVVEQPLLDGAAGGGAHPLPEVELDVVETRSSADESATASGRRSLGDLRRLRRAFSHPRFDAVFFPSVFSYVPLASRARLILGVHDAIAEDYPELVFPRWRQRLLWRLKCALAHRRADVVLTVSEYARQRIAHRFGHEADSLWVTGEAPDPVFRPLQEVDTATLARHGVGEGEPYLLYVGGVNPHKNVVGLVEALHRSEPSIGQTALVIVGDAAGDRFTPGLEPLVAKLRAYGMERQVRFAGYVPDGDLVHLYSGAAALVLPSFAEGYGLPAIEAAACGTAVVATRNSPLPELLGDGGLYIDPSDIEGLARALATVVLEPETRKRLAASAREHARRLTWQAAAQTLEQLLDRLDEGQRS